MPTVMNGTRPRASASRPCSSIRTIHPSTCSPASDGAWTSNGVPRSTSVRNPRCWAESWMPSRTGFQNEPSRKGRSPRGCERGPRRRLPGHGAAGRRCGAPEGEKSGALEGEMSRAPEGKKSRCRAPSPPPAPERRKARPTAPAPRCRCPGAPVPSSRSLPPCSPTSGRASPLPWPAPSLIDFRAGGEESDSAPARPSPRPVRAPAAGASSRSAIASEENVGSSPRSTSIRLSAISGRTPTR